MPSPDQILQGLTAIANQWWLLAVAWHVYFAVLVGGLVFGLRPTQRTAAILLALPLLSVSVLAWTGANPFNGLLLGIVSLALIGLAFRMPAAPVALGPTWAVAAGALLFAFGWVYPHFLDTFPAAAYLVAAPVGLVPCPTLSLVIGLTLVLGGFESRLWSTVLAFAGVFYGLFGALRLDVTIDFILLVGAGILLLAVYGPKPSAQRVSPVH
jgi:hypothetical protein